MSEGSINRVQQMFLAALEMPEEKRDAWLVEQCGDDAQLLDVVRTLLQYDAPEHDPLEQGLGEVLANLPATQVDADLAAREEASRNERTVVDCDDFLAKLSEVGVLSPDEFDSVSENLSSGGNSTDPRQLASQLVADGKLTNYQAAALLKGEPELLIDKYLILDLLDVGGMGMVFKAIHRTMNRVVAVKVISKQMLSSPEQIQRFQREVRVAATLEHPNVVRSYDADQSRGVHFLVMEYVRGDNLHKAVSECGPFSLERAVDCILQAAKGLGYAHRQGIIHRDIKPGNLMMTRDGVVKLLDLGLANVDESLRVLHHGSVTTEQGRGPQPTAVELTGSGVVLGTVSFMSPEQSLDTHLADARSDIYSLGCTFYYLLTAKAPYRGDTIFKVFMQHRDGKIPSLCDTRPDVPNKVAAICSRMLAKRPEERHQSMDELIAALEACEIAPPKKALRKNTRRGLGGKASQPVTVTSDESTLGQPQSQHATQLHRPRVSKSAGLWAGVALLLLVLILYGGSHIWTANEVELPGEEQVTTMVESDDQLTQDGIIDESSMSAADLLATGQWEWRVVKKLGASINTPHIEQGADMTADGLTIVFASRRGGGEGSHDLWVATRASTKAAWPDPVNLGVAINTPANEYVPVLSSDGLMLMFTRVTQEEGIRPFVSRRTSSSSAWSKAVPYEIDPRVRSTPWLTPNGRTLIVSRSTGSANGTSSKLFISRRSSRETPWGELKPVGPPVNTDAANESEGTISNDGRLLIFRRQVMIEAGNFVKGSRLWMTTRADWDAPWSEPMPLDFRDTPGIQMNPRLIPGERTLLFIANPPGETRPDIYEARLVRKIARSSPLDTPTENSLIDLPLVRTLEGHKHSVVAIDVTPDGRLAVSGSFDLSARLWNLQTGEMLHRFDFGHVSCLDISPDGRLLAVAGGKETLSIWNLETYEEHRVLPMPTGLTRGVCFSPDSRFLLTTSTDGTVRYWDVEQAEVVHSFPLGIESFNSAGTHISADGRRGVVCPSQGKVPLVYFFDLQEGELLRQFEVDEKRGTSGQFALSKDASTLLLPQGDVVTVCNLVSGAEKRVFGPSDGHGSVNSAVFLPDDRHVIFNHWRTVTVWDTQMSRQVAVSSPQKYRVRALAVTPNGRTILAGHAWYTKEQPINEETRKEDFAIRVWRMPDLDPIDTNPGEPVEIRQLNDSSQIPGIDDARPVEAPPVESESRTVIKLRRSRIAVKTVGSCDMLAENVFSYSFDLFLPAKETANSNFFNVSLPMKHYNRDRVSLLFS